MRHKLRMVMSASMEDVRLCTLALRGVCLGLGMGEDEVRTVELAVFEGLSNIVRHAYCFDSSRKVKVELEVTEEFCEVTLIDEGDEFDPRQIPPLSVDHRDPGSLPEGGMGVHIMREAMDEIDYRREGGRNLLRLRKYRRGQQ
ncbi:MAG: hypothetical protein DRG55_08310 [Deltaproteobacteria bacterium]|nr:MAG: hypothetical protein DRG69_05940 [Deltaproteobacteria bacterium]RLA99107.1 MAG: hypothetical protein DRG55_08310 [Deltaproteobacteria bacterium]